MRRLANELGWSGAKDGGRKRVQRALAELIEGGDVVTLRVGAFVGWFDSSGGPAGLSWPKKLPRARPMLASVYILGWRIQAAATRDTDVPRWQDGQAPPSADVPPPGAPMSHGLGRRCPTPSLNVRTEFEEEEPTSDGRSSFAGPEDPEATMDGRAGAEQAPQGPVRPGYSGLELARAEVQAVRSTGRDLVIRAGVDGAELIGFDIVVADPPPLPPGTIERLKALRPHVLAFLKGDEAPGPTGALMGPNEAMARAKRLIKALPLSTESADSEAGGLAICEAMGDLKPKSIETFRGYAERVRTRRMAPEDLIGAMRRASKRGVRNPGAKLVSVVQEMADASRG